MQWRYAERMTTHRSEYPPNVHHRAATFLLAVCPLAAFAVTAAAAATLPGIRTPSGNIRCLYLQGRSRNLLCTIDRSAYSTALQRRCMAPGGAGVDWHGFTLSPRGRGLVNCSGGIQYSPATERPVYATLAYAATRHLGPYTCTSRRIGLTCRTARGHGLFLSRASWRAW